MSHPDHTPRIENPRNNPSLRAVALGGAAAVTAMFAPTPGVETPLEDTAQAESYAIKTFKPSAIISVGNSEDWITKKVPVTYEDGVYRINAASQTKDGSVKQSYKMSFSTKSFTARCRNTVDLKQPASEWHNARIFGEFQDPETKKWTVFHSPNSTRLAEFPDSPNDKHNQSKAEERFTPEEIQRVLAVGGDTPVRIRCITSNGQATLRHVADALLRK